MQKNLKIIHQLEHFLDRYQKTNNKISQQNIGWHIAHSCKVINSIAEAIYISNPENARPKFTFLYYWILITNKIPRGKAKAPSFVIPEASLTKNEIIADVELAKTNLLKLTSTQKQKYFTHPIFGDLNVPKTLLFLAVHTHHHLKIIRDIVQ
jgi:hypothetical protein